MTEIAIEKLNTSKHNREDFNCGIEVLNVYLKQRANQEQKKRLTVTYVAVKPDQAPSPVFGYYTLSNSSLALYMVQSELKKHVPPTYEIPSVKLGRLAVETSMQNNGLGKKLLKHAFNRILAAAEISAVRGIEVIAKNPKALSFYEKYGFVKLHDSENLLFMPIETIQKI